VFNTVMEVTETKLRDNTRQEITDKIFDMFKRSQGMTEARILGHAIMGKSFGIGEGEFYRLLSIAISSSKKYNPDNLTAPQVLAQLKLFMNKSNIEQFVEQFKRNKQVPPVAKNSHDDMFIKPMLADAMKDVDQIMTRVKGDLTAEYKYDGQRAQVLYDKNSGYTIRSRSGQSIEHRYVDVTEGLDELIRNHGNIDSMILDGEIVPISPTGEYLSFQHLMVRNTKIYNQNVQVRLVVFDILELNGQMLSDKPLRERRQELIKLINGSRGIVEMTKFTNVSTADDIKQLFKSALADNCEGIMIKSLDQSYLSNKRLWIKYKKEYDSNMFDSFDLIPIGALFGKDARVGQFGSFLMACWNQDDQRYDTVCMVGTGFSNEMLTKLYQEMSNEITDNNQKPDNYNVSRFQQRKVKVWFKPTRVWEINGADFSYSNAHSLTIQGKQISLRFPKFLRERDDKSIDQATCVTEMQNHFKKRMQDNTTTLPIANDDDENN
jgi:DNA ligase-1